MLICKDIDTYSFGIGYVDVLSNSLEDFHYYYKEEFVELIMADGNTEKLLYIIFDLDNHILSMELGEQGRKNRVKIFLRNFNGDMYVFNKNIENLKFEYLDYYLDYYNEHVVINEKISELLIEGLVKILKYLFNNNEDCLKKIKKIDSEIILESADDVKEFDKFWKEIIKKCIDKNEWSKLKNKEGIVSIYPSEISVLPPDIRPDINNNYMVLQLEVGCRIMEKRGKACGFCTSFSDKKCYSCDLESIESQIEKLKREYPKKMGKVKKIFLSDGDALWREDISECMKFIRERLGEEITFDSFISTHTILNTHEDKWAGMGENGLDTVYWGVESASDKVLGLIDKPQSEKALQQAKKILENNKIKYCIIIIAGVGGIRNVINEEGRELENGHVKKTSAFINNSKCAGVYISKLQVARGSYLEKNQREGKMQLMSDEDINKEYRELIKLISKNVKGAYGNQFVVNEEG